MTATFRCSIVTPSETVFDDEITYASFPAWDGQHGVMAGQSPLLSQLGIGSLRIEGTEGGSRWYLIDGGFAQVQHNTLTLLTERALPAEALSLSEAEAELAEANARVPSDMNDRPRVERERQRAMAKVALARSTKA